MDVKEWEQSSKGLKLPERAAEKKLKKGDQVGIRYDNVLLAIKKPREHVGVM